MLKKGKEDKEPMVEQTPQDQVEEAQVAQEDQADVEALKKSAQVAAMQMMEALRQCETLSKALEEATQKAEQYQNQWLHLKGEFDNYRKRTTAELASARDEGTMETLKLMLPSLDNLDRALNVARGEGADSIAQGLEMVFSTLTASFEKKGLQVMDALGKPFDPTLHAAVLQEPCEDEAKKDTVAQVLQSGYLYNGKVLRYATVKVYV